MRSTPFERAVMEEAQRLCALAVLTDDGADPTFGPDAFREEAHRSLTDGAAPSGAVTALMTSWGCRRSTAHGTGDRPQEPWCTRHAYEEWTERGCPVAVAAADVAVAAALTETTCDSCGRGLTTQGCCGEQLQGERVRTHYYVPARRGHIRPTAADAIAAGTL